jgi:hypothetical protein
MLDKRQKDNEELELESVFSELKQKAGINDKEIDELANKSFSDLKDMRQKGETSQSSFYKPNLQSTPNLKTVSKMPPKGQAPDWKTQAKRNQ